jgi:aminopeptidase N
MLQSNPQTTYLHDYKAPDFLIEKVDLEFTLGEEVTHVKSRLEMHANPAVKAEKNLVLHGESLELKSISLDGLPLDASRFHIEKGLLTIANVPSAFALEIETIIKPQENTALSGLYKSSGNFCTQCEAQGFRRITYFLDRPDVMARYTTKIIADEKNYPVLLSNGNLIASGKLDNGKHWAHWEDPFKKPCYLFALVAGNLEFIEDSFETKSGRQVKLRIYVEKGNQDKSLHAMQSIKKSMRWDEEKYGREYDLDIYMIVAVSDFNMGAMENKGLNIFNTKYILAKAETATDMDFIHVDAVVAHEYFHNWTGNRITCRDWFQLSLKEGLTVFRDQNFTEDMTSRTVARIQDVNELRLAQFAEDAGPLAHPVRPDSYIEINNFYTATIYNKGAEVIRMMRTIIGDAQFHKGMDLYFERHDGQAVTIEEFVKAMEDASNVDLSQFRLWYSQAGTPVLNVQDHYDAAQKKYKLIIKQILPDSPGQTHKKPMHIPVKMGLLDQAGNEFLQEMLHVKKVEEIFEFDNVTVQPIPSLLRDFSAPVKLHFGYTDHALQTLFMHDTDHFNRWEAGQKYAINLMMHLVREHQHGNPLSIPDDFIHAFKNVFESMQKDKLLAAEMLSLPSEKYLAEQVSVIDVDAIHTVRESILFAMAMQMKNLFIELYQKNHDTKAYEFNMESVAKRQLKNLCLSYLMLLEDVNIHEDFALKQFRHSLRNNMTDTMGALRCLVNINGALREQALKEFYQEWKNEALVVDKWLALQATSKLPSTLYRVKQLVQHEAFDIKNPNKVYSLIGAFCQSNPVRFHAANGEGYQFLAEMILKLDAMNPQVAARMIKPLIDWRRYDKDRQKLMREQLEMILKEKKISSDVFELVTKSLKD